MHPRYEVAEDLPGDGRRRAGRRVGRSGRCATGVVLDDGPTAPAGVRLLSPERVELVIHEGRKRQVRRMCEAVGHRVIALRRVAYGPLELGTLGVGEHRRLDEAEIELLRAAAAPG